MRDVSLGGTFVETGTFVLPFSSRVVVSFRPPGVKRGGFRLDAMVVRRVSTGMGLMFLQMETEVIRALSAALSKYSGRDSGRGGPGR
jgi:hypothetical protein